MASDKELIQFITYINNLEPIEFTGIAKILCVSVFADNAEEEKKVRKYEDILSDLMDNFCLLGRRQRREVFKLLRQVEKDRVKEKTLLEKKK